jgi:hypothetical protein
MRTTSTLVNVVFPLAAIGAFAVPPATSAAAPQARTAAPPAQKATPAPAPPLTLPYSVPQPPGPDWRDIRHGLPIPTIHYADQPYVVRLRNGAWLCTLTTGAGEEGTSGEFAGVTLSADRGRTWTPLRPLEDPTGPGSSYSTPLVTPSGRAYVFYNYNGDNFRGPGGRRNDTLGWYVYRYSDDNGVTWSDRHRIPVRMTRIDRENSFQGKVQLFWCISHPVVLNSSVFISFSKVKTYPLGDDEGWLLHSRNLLTEPNPARIEWELLPEGEDGIRAPTLGRIQHEHNIVPLGDGSLYCMYRTGVGYLASTISRDKARTWPVPTVPKYADGRQMKNPMACPTVWRAANGRYLLWYHNHSLKHVYGRNPVWLAGGREENGNILWSQPEILHYDADDGARMSYPDMLEDGGEYYFFHTQKQIARTIKADRRLMEALWAQGTKAEVAREGLRLELAGAALRKPAVAFSYRPNLGWLRQGLTVDMHVRFGALTPGQILLDSRNDDGAGFWIGLNERGVPRFSIRAGDGAEFGWDADAGMIEPNKEHRLAFVVDGASRILSVIVDGKLCDGGSERPFGWAHIPGYLGEINPSKSLRLAPSFTGSLLGLRVYDRYLLTSEVVNGHRAR